jgi:hypothetical protein
MMDRSAAPGAGGAFSPLRRHKSYGYNESHPAHRGTPRRLSETFPVHFLLQTCTILDTRFREQFLSSNPIPFSFVQRT